MLAVKSRNTAAQTLQTANIVKKYSVAISIIGKNVLRHNKLIYCTTGLRPQRSVFN